MARSISFIVTNSGTISAAANGNAYTVPKDHPNYEGIKEAIVKDDVASLERLANVAKSVQDFSEGKVTVRDGVVFYDGEELHNTLTDRILSLMRDGFPFKPMLNFLNNLMENPSYHAVNELFAFLDHKGLPITEDGCFLAYKAVKADWSDKRTGKFDNSVGKVLELPRRCVDDNWRNSCSNGFHAGSLEYVKGFSNCEDDHIVIVKINPKDVVSVPPGEVTKLRTCKYEVVGEYDRAKLMAEVYMPDRLHTAAGVPATAPTTGGMGGYGYQDTHDEDEFDDEDDIIDDEDEDEDDFDDEEDEDDDYPRKY